MFLQKLWLARMSFIITAFAIINVMKFPNKIPRMKLLAAIAAVYGIVWIAMEGELYRAIIMAILSTALVGGLLIQRFLGGRTVSARGWILASAGIGAFFGVSVALMTLLFMAVKTGLHGHGPEFAQDQLEWVIKQIPLWGIAGSLGGLGLGLVTARFNGGD
jgi:hypothetical protein